MQIMCNVMLILSGSPHGKLVKLASIDIREQTIAQSNQLDRLDDSAGTAASQALGKFREEHPELGEASLTYTVTVRSW